MTTDQLAETTLVLPSLGESVEEATVTRWLKNEGDYIEAEEPVLEVATDKESHTEEQELSLSTKLTRQIHYSPRNCMSMFSANRQPAIRRSDDPTEARSRTRTDLLRRDAVVVDHGRTRYIRQFNWPSLGRFS